MLVMLSIHDKYTPSGMKFIRRFCVNTLKYSYKSYGEAEIRFLEYICRNGRVNFKRIAKKAGDGRDNLVYSGKVEIPKDSKITVFEPMEYRSRLCTNMALEVLALLKKAPKGLRVGLFDPKGEYSDLCLCILKYTSQFTVVSKNKALYTELAKSMLEENGVVLRACSRVSALSGCGLIIAPEKITEPFVPMQKAIVLTSGKPSFSIGCRVYSRYSLSLPKELEVIRPQDISAEDFSGALYSLGGVYALGSCVPFVCTGERDTQTTLSLRKYFEENFGT